MFQAQVDAHPEAVAVTFGREHLTYRALDERANQIAHALLAEGIRPDDRVAICLERSLDMVSGLLGILKAGAAFVPIVPSLPRERVTSMLNDSGARFVIGHSKWQGLFGDVRTLWLDAERARVALLATSLPAVSVHGNNLAYVLFTSGSTGRPKGVMVSHDAITNELVATQAVSGPLDASDVYLQLATFSFDVAVNDIFWSLTAGARLVLVEEGEHRDPARILEIVRDQGVTTLDVVPSMLSAILAEPEFSGCSSLRRVHVGGEALPAELVRAFHVTRPDLSLVNMYGPTECAVTVSQWRCPANPIAIALGREWPETSLYVLDERLVPVPAGGIGELYIGGRQVARGYAGDPGLTSERFVPDPFSEPGRRMYRTGDRVRLWLDGHVEFVGRVDEQVKVRGFRIELSEIESVLGSDPSVRDCVVVARDREGHDDKVLVAYVVPQSGALDVAMLRMHAAAQLPEYMIPSAFVVMDALPVSAVGKIDRAALPRPVARTGSSSAPPSTPVEIALATAWAEALGLASLGVDDDVFDLGAHSLLAIRVASRMRRDLGVNLSVATVLSCRTVASLAHAVSELRPVEQHAIEPVRRDERIPLSYGQEAIWLHAMQTTGALYAEPCTIRIPGPLDVPTLQRAFGELAVRHEIWRTTFPLRDGHPVQIIHPPAPIELPFVDLTHLPPSERWPRAVALASELASRSFDLAKLPLVRAALVRLADDDHALFCVEHHILSDAVSMFGVVASELQQVYRAFLTGSALPPVSPIQYADYAVWQRKTTSDAELALDLSYWKQQLADLPTLQLPVDRPRPARPTHTGERICIELPGDLTQRLKALARAEGVTLFVVLQSAFCAVLARYVPQEEIVLGTQVDRRDRPELERLLGYFLNTLVLRTDVRGDPTFRELISRARVTNQAALAHQELPFSRLVDALKPPRVAGQHPLFQVAFVLEPDVPTLRSGWSVSQTDFHGGLAHFDLSVELDVRADGIIGRFEYSTELFDRETMDHLAASFELVLDSVTRDVGQRLSRLRLLSADERRRMVTLWNPVELRFGAGRQIHRTVEAQVDAHPDSVAVTFGREQLTYRALDERANQIAHALQAAGVKREDRIAVCLERSLDMVCALLGILKAGAAFVPIVPSLPRDRVTSMLTDAGARVVIGHSQWQALFGDVRTIWLDTERAQITSLATSRPNVVIDGDNLAYVLFTSGSTGRPKGVMVSHDAIMNELVAAQALTGPLDGTDVYIHLAAFSFDLSVHDIFWPLTTGARVVIVEEGEHKDPARILEIVRDQGVTTIFPVPTMLRALVAEPTLASCTSLRRVIAGGEALPVELVRELTALRPDLPLTNMYGPTECAMAISQWPCPPDPTAISLGRDWPETALYVLDDHLEPVPVGVIGELYISGRQVTRGYANAPAMTAERFVPDPFSKLGRRMYRTGDRVRRWRDGFIEFVGRVDHQVKIRGYRIELSEIESVLASHPSVRDSVVVARSRDGHDDKQLIAYAVPRGDDLDVTVLREHLAAQLADYMVPAAIVVMDALPLSAAGKIDRAALPAPTFDEPGHVAPRTALEEVVAAMWREKIGVDRIGVHDDFFDLGGHSLLAVRVLAQVVELFGVTLPMSTFFRASTLEDFAVELSNTIEPGRAEEVAMLILQASSEDAS